VRVVARFAQYFSLLKNALHKLIIQVVSSSFMGIELFMLIGQEKDQFFEKDVSTANKVPKREQKEDNMDSLIKTEHPLENLVGIFLSFKSQCASVALPTSVQQCFST
jgi:hypothetical protein